MAEAFLSEIGVEPIGHIGYSRPLIVAVADNSEHKHYSSKNATPSITLYKDDAFHTALSTDANPSINLLGDDSKHFLLSNTVNVSITPNANSAIHGLYQNEPDVAITFVPGRYLETPYKSRVLETPQIPIK
jgi:hypothetical protein